MVRRVSQSFLPVLFDVTNVRICRACRCPAAPKALVKNPVRGAQNVSIRSIQPRGDGSASSAIAVHGLSWGRPVSGVRQNLNGLLSARRGFAGDAQPPEGKDPTMHGGQENSNLWTLVFSVLVIGAIGFTVWQEVDGHETQNAQREANRRFAEERERLEANRDAQERP